MHPGWPLSVGPIRVRAGVVRLRPVRTSQVEVLPGPSSAMNRQAG